MPSSRFSEWNIVRLRVQIRIFGGRSLRRRSRGPSLTARGTRAAAFALASATEHLHVFGHYAQARTLLAGLFVVPGIQLKPAFDEDLAPFLEVLLRNLGLPPPKRHVHERDLLLLFAIFPRVNSVYGDADVRNRGSFRRVPHLRVTSQISDKQNPVEVAPKRSDYFASFSPCLFAHTSYC